MADDESKKREWTNLDHMYGEEIASDFYRGVQEEVDHYEAAHHHGPLKAIADFLLGNEQEDCLNPRCNADTVGEAEEASQSWWERWLRGSGDSGEGSSGSSD